MDWKWDVNFMSHMKLEGLIKSQGYVDIKSLWYWNPIFSFSRGLKPLNNDKDVLQFSKDVVGHEVIDVYVEHKVCETHVIVDPSELDNIDDAIEVNNEEVDVKEPNDEQTDVNEPSNEQPSVNEHSNEQDEVNDEDYIMNNLV